jgi:hypothetical protein
LFRNSPPKASDAAVEARLKPVAQPPAQAPLLILEQALSSPAPFIAVMAHGVMVRLKPGDEVFEGLQLGFESRETCE